MEAANRRWSLALAVFALLFAGSIKAAGPTQAADALISDCKTVSCLRNLLRGPEGPAGPRGPKGDPGGARQQDVYAGSFRMGKLIALDATAQCSGRLSPVNQVNKFNETGLMGLVETSTGWLVHLCIGTSFPQGDAGVGMTGLSRNGYSSYQYHFKTSDCSGSPYVLIFQASGEPFDSSGNYYDNAGEIKGVLGKLMGKPRVAIVPAIAFGSSSENRVFAMPGAIEKFAYVSATSNSIGGCYPRGQSNGTIPEDFVELLPNNPSITGLPNSPQTPYTLVDVQ